MGRGLQATRLREREKEATRNDAERRRIVLKNFLTVEQTI